MQLNTGSNPGMSLRFSALLLLAGQLLYVVITLLHAGGEANNHPAIFATYAANSIWTAVHVAQFLCMSVLLAGLFGLALAIDNETGTARWVSRLAAALAVVALALYGAVLAVDGVALKQAVNAWANAPEGEKATRFAVAESVRWLEWGMRSYESYVLGLALLLLAVAIARTSIPLAISIFMGLAGLVYLVQGWTAGSEGFSQLHVNAIIASEVLNAVWMIWLIIASRMSAASAS
jgi:hypothetical protein